MKSLLRYGHRLGYLPFDVGAPVKLPAIKGTLAERIMGEAEVHRLLALEPDARTVPCSAWSTSPACGISEACGLAWRDLSRATMRGS